MEMDENYLHYVKRKGDQKGRPYKNKFSFYTLYRDNSFSSISIMPLKKKE
jgi:hypothetical protein